MVMRYSPVKNEMLFLWAMEGSGEVGIYGLEIEKIIAACGEGSVKLPQGSLYTTTNKLKEKGLIESYDGGSTGGAHRTYFRLTEKGEEELKAHNTFFERLRAWNS